MVGEGDAVWEKTLRLNEGRTTGRRASWLPKGAKRGRIFIEIVPRGDEKEYDMLSFSCEDFLGERKSESEVLPRRVASLRR